MDTVLGVLIWGGLLLLTLRWIARTIAAGDGRDAVSHPVTRILSDEGTEAQESREDDALADGLVVGHFLSRDHHRNRIARLEDEIAALEAERERWLQAAATGDDRHAGLDRAEFDALGDFGVEPWADERFDDGDDF